MILLPVSSVLADLLMRACGNTLGVYGAAAGMHLAAVFQTRRDDAALAEEAAKEDLWLWPLSKSYITKDVRTGFILGYGSVATHAIPRAVGKLRSALGRRLM